MSMIGYVPFESTTRSLEAEWLHQYLGVSVCVLGTAPTWNQANPGPLPPLDQLAEAMERLLPLPSVVLEGPGGFLWAAVLRARGYGGALTVLPYINPRGWRDVLAAAVFRRYLDDRDRIFVGSRPSAALYAALGVPAEVGEPYGIDDRIFRRRPDADRVRAQLGIPPGRILLYAGRAQPDKDLYRFLRVGLKARLLFEDLTVVVASHVLDDDYLSAARELRGDSGVRFVIDPAPQQLADLYSTADVFLTASTSGYETFGRAPAQALACGCPVVAPRYDGFVELLAQEGGTIVDLAESADDGSPRADEAGLLRAVYDLLSSPTQHHESIAATAQRRFGRSRTISLLDHLVDGVAARPSEPMAAVQLRLPRPWLDRLTEIAEYGPEQALSWCWNHHDHQLAACDPEFAAQVRRSLCVAPPRDREMIACR
jgi:glycosyltransferase involved in cell wall biosynthesis